MLGQELKSQVARQQIISKILFLFLFYVTFMKIFPTEVI